MVESNATASPLLFSPRDKFFLQGAKTCYTICTMKRIFSDTRILDEETRRRFALTSDIMMENAAAALHAALDAHFAAQEDLPRSVLILTGSGDNGGDGMALARRLAGQYEARVAVVRPPQSESCVAQYQRARAAKVPFYTAPFDMNSVKEWVRRSGAVVDCVFGSGFHGEMDDTLRTLFETINRTARESGAFRLACDIPSGMAFCADVTVTMGALKTALFSDAAKDFCGEIRCADLGISRALFEGGAEPQAFLLEEGDMRLPERRAQNVHKGSFGHAAVVAGDKPGAGILAACAAVRFGAGLCTVVSGTDVSLNPLLLEHGIMSGGSLPAKTTAVALGMGLGRSSPVAERVTAWLTQCHDIPAVLDADILYTPCVPELLRKRPAGLVLTPHVKECAALFAQCGLGSCTAAQLANQRLTLAAQFTAQFPQAVLVLKGANTLLCHDGQIFVAAAGCASLAKGGSGDVLAGLICGLLAQGYAPLDAAQTAVLAHGLASQKAARSYSLTPMELIMKANVK